MVNTITANDIKTRGVNALKEGIGNNKEAFISVRGKNKYVVLSLKEYSYLRECELEAAIFESKNDIENGKFFCESIDKHLERIKNA